MFQFWILLFSAFFIYTYNNVFMMATPLLLVHMGCSETIAGLQGTLFLILAVLLRFFFGPLADRRGRRLVMLIGSAAFFGAAILLVQAAAVWQVVALRLVQAVGLSSYFPAASATAASCAPDGQKGTYIGILRITASLSLMSGPALALYLIGKNGYSLFFWSMAATAFLGMAAIFFISPAVTGPQPQVQANPENHGSSGSSFSFWRLLRMHSLIMGSVFAASISYGVFMAFSALFVEAHTNISNAGFFFTLYSCGGIFANGAFGWLSDRFGRLKLALCAFLLLGSGMIFFALLPQLPFCFYPAGLLAGAGYYGGIVVLTAWLAEKAEPHERTAVLSLQGSALDLGIAAGSGLFGLLLTVVKNGPLLYGLLGGLYLVYGLRYFLKKSYTA